MAKKTVKVTEVLAAANHMLANHKDCNIGGIEYGQSFRLGVVSLMQNILHRTGNYQGFKYLTSEDMPINAPPGIIFGTPNEYPDDSRRLYFG